MDIIQIIFLIPYVICSLLLLAYGLNTYYIIALYLRKRQANECNDAATEAAFAQHFKAKDPAKLPLVTTQIPLYNEINVAERVIRAVAAIEYPHERHEIQVLDDSDDETVAAVDRVVADLQAKGHWVEVVRRTGREGYKAGALALGMAQSSGEYIAIFDSDFIPPSDFLWRSLPHLWADPGIGLVQARWDHLNRKQNYLTRAQSIGIDGHFVVEQTARNRNGLFMNFCGTAGVWRPEAIKAAGGWSHDTVTEDLDLSYRAQLCGWRFHYLPSLLVPAELPATYGAFKSQQSRWAKGTLQTARKLLPHLWRAPIPLMRKLQATVHLTQYTLHLQMALLAFLMLPLTLSFGQGIVRYDSALLLSLLIPAALGPSIGYAVCQHYGHPRDWLERLLYLPFLLVVGFGICLSNAKAVLEGLFGNDCTFVRTPKSGGNALKDYRVKRHWLPRFEMLFAAYCALTVGVLLMMNQYELIPFVLIYMFGFSLVGWRSLREARVRG